MALIRHIRIQNFRGIHKFDWFPSDRVNCLIGPGDSGKTTVLDAIDLFKLNRPGIAGGSNS
jgi:predicted ATP-dependent endonuclease of OLD family